MNLKNIKAMRAAAIRATMLCIGTIFSVAGLLGAVASIKDPSTGYFSLATIIFGGTCLTIAFSYAESMEIRSVETANKEDNPHGKKAEEIATKLFDRLPVEPTAKESPKEETPQEIIAPGHLEDPKANQIESAKPKTEKKKRATPAKKKPVE